MCVKRTLTMKSTTFLYITDKVSSHHSIIHCISKFHPVLFRPWCCIFLWSVFTCGDFVYCSSAPCLWPVPCQLQRWIAFCCQPTKYSSQWWIVALTDAQIGFGRTNQKKKTRPLATASHHLLLCLCPKAAQGISPFVCSRPPINRKDKGPFRNLSHSYHSPLKWC